MLKFVYIRPSPSCATTKVDAKTPRQKRAAEKRSMVSSCLILQAAEYKWDDLSSSSPNLDLNNYVCSKRNCYEAIDVQSVPELLHVMI
jgi:hypothetical protein